MKFYRLLADPSFSERWFLSTPVTSQGDKFHAYYFNGGNFVNNIPILRIPIRQIGEQVDFNFAAFDMLVTPKDLNLKLEKVLKNRIQRIPIEIEQCDQEFEILNILDVVQCVDETRSEFQKWKKEDNRPDKMGDYRCFYELMINGKAAQKHKMFRVKGWKVAVIVDEDIKQLIIDHGTTGVVFQPVN